MPTRIDRRAPASALLLSLSLALAAGCGGEPSERGVKNARAFEALLTAVSLKDRAELEKDARVVEERHASGELSDAAYGDLRAVVDQARAGDWAAAERSAYAFRARFGDDGAFFD